ncbi:hypothetical protein P692DRAFT_20835854 [Suillus brevipes Sb2]|nr:hypothetical protein P692DRAFT_20835854 [Suillus brevipes Sb2]
MLSPINPSRSFTTSLNNLQTIHQLSSPSRTYKTDIAAFQPPTTSTPRDASSVQSATSINDYWELPAYSCRVRVFRWPAHVRESLPPFFRHISTSPSYRCTTAARGSPVIKFIGELFKLQMLTERIMHEYEEAVGQH